MASSDTCCGGSEDGRGSAFVWRRARPSGDGRSRPASAWGAGGEGGVLALGLPVWTQYFISAAPANALVIEVTTEKFAWNVRYAGPDGVFGRIDPKLITLDNPLGIDAADPRAKDDIVGLNVL